MARNGNDGGIVQGLIAGAVGGLVASWAMNAVGPVLGRLFEENGGGDSPGESGEAGEGGGEDPKVQVASLISERVLHHRLDRRERELAGPAIHYAFGTAVGGVYGVLAE